MMLFRVSARRALPVAAMCAGLTLLALRATHASAPADQYAEFFRSTPEIADRKTELIWRRTPASGLDFNASKGFCATIPPLGTWRLPSVKESLTLIDEERHDEYPRGTTRIVQRHIDQAAFGDYPDSVFWTSNQEGGSAYALNIEDATVSLTPAAAPISVRCVKSF